MICVISLFGEMDFQSALKKRFHSNSIYFIEENCVTSVQLTERVEARCKEVDAVIIYSTAINMDILREYVEELRVFTENLRVVLVLNGERSSYLRSQLNEFWEMKIDLIFDQNGFDSEEMIQILRKGKLTNKDFRQNRKEIGFVGDVEDIPIPEEFMEPPEDDKRVLKFSDKKEKVATDRFYSDPKSFAEPQGHYTVGILNAARGAGATWTAVNLARYFAIHNYKTCIADMSGDGSVGVMKLKNIDTYTEAFDVEELKGMYNVTVIDCGTPIEVTPDGENFKLMKEYTPETIQCFNRCHIKIIMGFSEPWNIEKISYFFKNEHWRSMLDNSYLFIVAGNPEKVKKLYPEGNVFSREDDYREYILDAFRKEEDK